MSKVHEVPPLRVTPEQMILVIVTCGRLRSHASEGRNTHSHELLTRCLDFGMRIHLT